MFGKSLKLPEPGQALPGRERPQLAQGVHYVLKTPLLPPFPDNMQFAMFGLGCFWGAERKFWETPGVYSTAVGYAGGYTPNPLYEEVCTGMTGHNEVVRVVFNPMHVAYRDLLGIFWENHDPTQGMRQGNDVGTQYRSAIYVYNDEQMQEAINSLESYQARLLAENYGTITTEVESASTFYYAEEYHQQYLARNPRGYCGLGGTGVSYC